MNWYPTAPVKGMAAEMPVFLAIGPSPALEGESDKRLKLKAYLLNIVGL